MITAYRLSRSARRASCWTGVGAEIAGGRWNSKGTAIVYCSDSLALCQLETLVNISSVDNLIGYDWASVEIPDDLVIEVEDKFKLPKGWDSYPRIPETAYIGDHWVNEQLSAVLAVPTSIEPQGRNYLLNPAHPDFAKLKPSKPKPLELDKRLKQQSEG